MTVAELREQLSGCDGNDDAPLDYLEWLADQNAALVRYVRSRRVKAEQEDGE